MMSLCIIDGYNLIFKAFYSIPALATISNNLPIGAVYGFIYMLEKIFKNNNKKFCVIALDSGKKTFRSDFYPSYKAHREETDKNLKIQFPVIREIIKSCGFNVIEINGFEADDIIATYSKVAIDNDIEVKIISSDKDLIQLMQNSVLIFNSFTKSYATDNLIIKKYGIFSNQIVDYLSLIGDSSDNIPGIKKIGPKIASKILFKFHTLSILYKNIKKINLLRIKRLVKNSKSNAFLSKKLITLNRNVFLDLSIKKLQCNIDNYKNLLNFCTKYNFQSFKSKKLFSSYKRNTIKPLLNATLKILWKTYSSIAKFQKFYFYFDNNIFFYQFKCLSYHINLNTEYSNSLLSNKNNNSISSQNILLLLLNIIQNNKIKKICLDLKSTVNHYMCEKKILKNFNDILTCSCLMFASKQKLNLNQLQCIYEKKNKNIYYLGKIRGIYKIVKLQILRKKKNKLYKIIEKVLYLLLIKIENKGIKINLCEITSLKLGLIKKLKLLKTQIFQSSNNIFNINSFYQISKTVLCKFKIIDKIKLDRHFNFVGNSSALSKYILLKKPIVKKILTWRHYAKLSSTYVNIFQKSINDNCRLNASFSNTATSTGRLSSHNPNLQNIPTKTNNGNRVRKYITARKDYHIACIDYSQIEIRILADIANIKNLKKTFIKKMDIHAVMAAKLFNTPFSKVSDKLRKEAKRINFGIIYGQNSYNLSNSLNINKKKSLEYIKIFFNQYPGVKEYIDTTVYFAEKQSYIKTLMGKKCYIQNINSNNYSLKNIAQRASINTPMQSIASEIIKKSIASLNIDMQNFLILQVHDELLFEIPSNILNQTCSKIKNTMMNAFHLSVPIKIEITCGKSWYNKK